ncbi:MAG TPA: YIP1 family protein [Anaeromyxobacteraceae bacterium]|nr:YIP1 family protein [Anaeromyxobacteraceae bacterium]
MRARCYRCQNTFDTDRFGVQKCPSCGSEVFLPDPSAPKAAPTEAPPPAGGPLPPAPGFGPPPPGWPPPPPAFGPLPAGVPPPAGEKNAPFAERRQRGLFASYLETWKLVALDASRFFREVRPSAPGSAVLFGVISFTLGTWVSLGFRFLTARGAAHFVAQLSLLKSEGVDAGPLISVLQGLTLTSMLAQLLLTPLFGLFAIYLAAALFHLLLLVVHGAPRGFEATLTLVGYAYGIFLLEAVPVCGGLIAVAWYCVIAIQGLAEIQRCGIGKAVFAVVTPMLLACLCMCATAGLAVKALWPSLITPGASTPSPPTSL